MAFESNLLTIQGFHFNCIITIIKENVGFSAKTHHAYNLLTQFFFPFIHSEQKMIINGIVDQFYQLTD